MLRCFLVCSAIFWKTFRKKRTLSFVKPHAATNAATILLQFCYNFVTILLHPSKNVNLRSRSEFAFHLRSKSEFWVCPKWCTQIWKWCTFKNDALRFKNDSLRSENDALRFQNDALRSENDALRFKNDGLRFAFQIWICVSFAF